MENKVSKQYKENRLYPFNNQMMNYWRMLASKLFRKEGQTKITIATQWLTA
jgi:hypothetical protein